MPDEAMRQLSSTIRLLVGNTPAVGQDARLGAKLYRVAYNYASRRFFRDASEIKAGRPKMPVTALAEEAADLRSKRRNFPQIAALLNARHEGEPDYVKVSSEAVRKLLKRNPREQG